MKIKYAHTNIVTKDWKRLAYFYEQVFGCVPILPQRTQKGDWLDRGTGVANAHLQGMHLRLPGFGEQGPTLEIFQYADVIDIEKPLPNKKGFGHIAFQVDDVMKVLSIALEHGAEKVGEVSRQQVPGVGLLTFIYIADPDGNIIELQNWS